MYRVQLVSKTQYNCLSSQLRKKDHASEIPLQLGSFYELSQSATFWAKEAQLKHTDKLHG